MKKLFLASVSLFLLVSIAAGHGGGPGSKKYLATMLFHIHMVDTAKFEPTFIKAANTFQRIADAEPSEWLPAYYAAYSYINAAMATPVLDNVDLYCDKAEELAAAAGEREGADLSELRCLISLAYTARIRVDLFSRGLGFSEIADQLLTEAAAIDNTNPRVNYLRARLILGRPKQFGGGTEAALPLLKAAGIDYEKRTLPEDSLLPDWGRKRTADILAQLEPKGQ